MINPSETIPPELMGGLLINPSETIPPDDADSTRDTVLLAAGESIAASYVIDSPMNSGGKQANVFFAKRWGKSYAVKLYHNGWQPSDRMKQFLTSVRHPNIANVVECGEYRDHYFEIYDYYPEGTLENAGAATAAQIKNVIVPSINEGLHELHRNGVVHCDIKPSNLFFTDNGGRVVIGDCGISGYANSNGKLVDTVRGTPEYAPPVKSLLWNASMSPAYDYGSFGLVICRMLLGRSLFDGMSLEEIARAWENGLELPSQLEGRLLTLVKGLLTADENERWDYTKVKRWCEGEFIPSTGKSLYERRAKKPTAIRPLIFGQFDGETLSVSTLHQLANAIKKHWEQATRIVKRRELVEFVRQFDKELPEKVRPLASYQDGNAAAFTLLMLIESDSSEIFYCGKSYPSLSVLVDNLAAGRDEIAKKFVSTGLLVYYLREKGAERSLVDKLEQLIKWNGYSDMTAISAICFSLQGKKTLEVFGKAVSSLSELVPVISKQKIKDVESLLESDKFKAWLFRLGYEKELRRLSEL